MNDETVLVTGASSGIGLELARYFAMDGSRLVLVARNGEALEKLAADLRLAHEVQVTVLPADLSQPDAPARIFQTLKASGTTVDVLVNNAGFGATGRFVELSLERQMDILQVNVVALTHLCRLFLPGMVDRRRGGILNVASTAGFQPGPGMAVYYASKAYVLSLTEAIAEEVADSGVTVTALCPGPTITNFNVAANAKVSATFNKLAMSAAEVARMGHEAFRKRRVVAISGFRNKVGAFSVRLGPRSVVRKLAGRFNSLKA